MPNGDMIKSLLSEFLSLFVMCLQPFGEAFQVPRVDGSNVTVAEPTNNGFLPLYYASTC